MTVDEILEWAYKLDLKHSDDPNQLSILGAKDLKFAEELAKASEVIQNLRSLARNSKTFGYAAHAILRDSGIDPCPK